MDQGERLGLLQFRYLEEGTFAAAAQTYEEGAASAGAGVSERGFQDAVSASVGKTANWLQLLLWEGTATVLRASNHPPAW